MESVFQNDDVRNFNAFGMSEFTSNFDCTFIGFQAAVAEENCFKAGVFNQFLSDLFLKVNVEVVGAVNEFRSLIGNGSD